MVGHDALNVGTVVRIHLSENFCKRVRTSYIGYGPAELPSYPFPWFSDAENPSNGAVCR